MVRYDLHSASIIHLRGGLEECVYLGWHRNSVVRQIEQPVCISQRTVNL